MCQKSLGIRPIIQAVRITVTPFMCNDFCCTKWPSVTSEVIQKSEPDFVRGVVDRIGPYVLLLLQISTV